MAKTKHKYGSFWCPNILISGMDDLVERWPGKLNHAKILFFASSYACQKDMFVYKSVEIDSDTEKQKVMVRVTEPLSAKVDEVMGRHEDLSKTDFYIIALTQFLAVCDDILKKVDGSFLAEGEHGERGLVLRKTIYSLFPDSDNSSEQLCNLICEETFDSGDKVFCVTTRTSMASMLLSNLFTEEELDPRAAYPKDMYPLA